jgi:hypothetical protein
MIDASGPISWNSERWRLTACFLLISATSEDAAKTKKKGYTLKYTTK